MMFYATFGRLIAILSTLGLILQFHSAIGYRVRRADNDFEVSAGNGVNLPFLSKIGNNSSFLSSLFSNTNIGRQTNANLNVGNGQPRGGIGQETNFLGLFNQQKGIAGGVDQQGRIGGEWGNNVNFLNDLFNVGRHGQAQVDLQNGNAVISDGFGLGPLFQTSKGVKIDWQKFIAPNRRR